MKRKVALVYPFFPHYREAIVRALLHSPEHDYLLVGDDRAVEPGIATMPIEDRSRFAPTRCRYWLGPWLVQSGLIQLSLRPDLESIIYLGNPYYLSTWASALLARLMGKRVLFWTHGWTCHESGPKAWLRKLFYRIPHGLLLYGHMAKMSGLNNGFPAHKLHVVYNSLDYPKQKETRDRLRPEDIASVHREYFADPTCPLVVCSARLTPECRLDLLLLAQHHLRKEGHLFNVLLIGDGPSSPALKSLARKRNLPVYFLGACYDDATLARLISAAHVTVSPGKVGLTAMQSLGFGTPVITHDNWQAQGPEWEAIRPGTTGDFFHHNNLQDLVRVIRLWTRPEQVPPPIRQACQAVVEQLYNPEFQRQAIDRAVRGQPADDLFWLKPAPNPS